MSTRARRGPLAAATATPARALTLVGAGGVAIAVQAYVNGRLSGQLGSYEVAAAVNNLVGLVALVVYGVAAGSTRRALAHARSGPRPPLWLFAGGALGSLLVIVSAAAAPKVGVALLTVALVCGQTGGGLPVDASGISPAGRQPITAPRLLGVGLAIAAVVITALGSGGHPHAGLLALAVLAGVAGAIQPATNGRLAERFGGEPAAAALVNFAVGFTALALFALAVVGGRTIHWGASEAPDWIGGILGAYFVLVSAAAVSTVGVLRLLLVAVAGQSAGALAIDLVAPVPGETVGVTTVVGLVLTIVAVFVSGRAREQAAEADA